MDGETKLVRRTCDISRKSAPLWATICLVLSVANEILAAAVYQAVGKDERLTVSSVRAVLDELATHPSDCACGTCCWVEKANDAEIFWAAKVWQAQGRRTQRLANR